MEYTTLPSTDSSLPDNSLDNGNLSETLEQQYILPLGQTLQEDQQLAIEVKGQDGIKYLYILSDTVPVQSISTDQVTDKTTEKEENSNNSNSNIQLKVDKTTVEENNDDKLKCIEDRSCGTMTEENYLEPEKFEVLKIKTIIVSPEKHVGTKGPGKTNKVLVNERSLSSGIRLNGSQNLIHPLVSSKSLQTRKGNNTGQKKTLVNLIQQGWPDKKVTGECKTYDKAISKTSDVVYIRDKNSSMEKGNSESQALDKTQDGSNQEPALSIENGKMTKGSRFIGKSCEEMLEKEVNIMNEMKVLRNNTCNSNRESHRNRDIENENPVNKSSMEVCEEKDKTSQKEDKKSENSDKCQNKVDISCLDNEDRDENLKLDNVDDETCKDILASLEIFEGKKENQIKSQEINIKDTKPKFQYERPTTRNMTKNKNKQYEVIRKGKKGKITFECRICRKVYTHRQTLQEHIKNHKNESFSCDICGKTFNSERKLSKHVKTHSTDPAHLCYICGESFRIKETLENHMYTHSETGEKPFKCDVCGAGFIKKYYLVRHQTCHTGLKPYSCSDCDKKFRTRGDLQRHERIHGEKPGVKQFKCKICEKRYCAESGLIRHERAHKGEKPFSCEICSKGFSMQGDLKRHNKTHFGGVYFDCKICGKTLTSDVGFKRHQRMHSGEKPYKCSICNNNFIDLWGLMQHKKLHVFKVTV